MVRASEAGRPVLENFSPNAYQGHNQVWCIAEGPDGLMYFGNRGSVLEYDGRGWRRIKVPTTFVRGIAFGADGRLYAGGQDELGYLAPDATGTMTYVSLLANVPEAMRPVGAIFSLAAHEDAVFFASQKLTLRWNGTAFAVVGGPAQGYPHFTRVGRQLFLHRPREGLRRWRDGAFAPFGDAPEWRGEVTPVLVDDGAGGIVGYDQGGLFRLDGEGRRVAWPAASTEALHRAKVNKAVRLADGTWVFASATQALLQVGRDGQLLARVDESSGLDSGRVLALATDREDSVWIGTGYGAARLELSTPLTLFDRANGLPLGLAADICRHRGELYVAPEAGLARLVPGDPARGTPTRFERVPGSGDAKFWSLLDHPAGLLCGARNSLELFAGGRLQTLVRYSSPPMVLRASRSQPNLIFVGRSTGFSLMQFLDGRWNDLGTRPDFDGEVRAIEEDRQGNLWLGTTTRGVIRLRRPPGEKDWRNAVLTAYLGTHGLPADQGWTLVTATPEGPLFVPQRGAYRWDEAAQKFVAESRFCLGGDLGTTLSLPIEGRPHEFWFQAEPPDGGDGQLRVRRLQLTPGSEPRWTHLPRKINEVIGYGGARYRWWESGPAGEVLWLVGAANIVRLETSRSFPAVPEWAAVIRSVQLPGGRTITPHADAPVMELPYSHEPLVFTVAGTRFASGAPLEFQWRLDGFQDAWSPWTSRHEITFTGLSGGSFALEVRARDNDGGLSRPTRLAFVVHPPWNRTTAAYLVYGAVAVVGVLGLVRWRVARSERERRRLEALVAQRTVELQSAKDAADAASRAKSLFLASMSHELRTPLNSVLGFTQIVLREPGLSGAGRERLRLVNSSGEHLLKMINEVLDLSKIEAGKVELNLAPLSLPQLLREVAAAGAPRAEAKGLQFNLELAADLPDLVLGDAQKLRQVLDNLVANAVKFTQAGRVGLSALREGDTVRLAVSDSGIGVAPADRERIFQPFQQAGVRLPSEPGTGLGLAVSSRYVALMGGTLRLEDASGGGSVFWFRLKLAPAPGTFAEPMASQAVAGYAGPRRRVLVVDDLEVNRTLLVDLLAPLGFDVATAVSGEEALAHAAGHDVDLVLLDLRMPGIDGFEVARRLRYASRGAPPKIIAMSASVLTIGRAEVLAAGCDDYLPKPFRESDLIDKVGLALGLAWQPAATVTELPVHLEPGTNETLRRLAERGDVAALRQALQDARGDHPEAGVILDQLAALAASYQLRRIAELLSREVRPPSV